MLDIVKFETGKDLKIENSIAPKAANVVDTQLSELVYAPGFGVDLKYFLQDDLQFQTSSFRAYLVQRLIEHQVNVTEVITTLETFLQSNTFFVGDAAPASKGLMI